MAVRGLQIGQDLGRLVEHQVAILKNRDVILA
jgi:hypothetical protein